METGITTPYPMGTGERDVFTVLSPGNLMALALHAFNKFIRISGVLRYIVDRLNQIQRGFAKCASWRTENFLSMTPPDVKVPWPHKRLFLIWKVC